MSRQRSGFVSSPVMNARCQEISVKVLTLEDSRNVLKVSVIDSGVSLKDFCTVPDPLLCNRYHSDPMVFRPVDDDIGRMSELLAGLRLPVGVS